VKNFSKCKVSLSLLDLMKKFLLGQGRSLR